MTTKQKSKPCVLCEIGCNMSSYHKLRHAENPKSVDEFKKQLMLEPLDKKNDFVHPPFYVGDLDDFDFDCFDDFDMSDDY